MSADFDPYHKWLGIPPEDQPPNHYRLLGIELFESDDEVIESAADQRMNHLRTFQGGKRATYSQELLGQISRAKICLLDAERRAEYDLSIRSEIADQQAQDTAAPPIPAASPPLPDVSIDTTSTTRGSRTNSRAQASRTPSAPAIGAALAEALDGIPTAATKDTTADAPTIAPPDPEPASTTIPIAQADTNTLATSHPSKPAPARDKSRSSAKPGKQLPLVLVIGLGVAAVAVLLAGVAFVVMQLGGDDSIDENRIARNDDNRSRPNRSRDNPRDNSQIDDANATGIDSNDNSSHNDETSNENTSNENTSNEDVSNGADSTGSNGNGNTGDGSDNSGTSGNINIETGTGTGVQSVVIINGQRYVNGELVSDANDDGNSNNGNSNNGNSDDADDTNDSGDNSNGGNDSNTGNAMPNEVVNESGLAPVPTDEELEIIRTRIGGAYELDSARGNDERLLIAKRMIDAASLESRDKNEAYGLLTMALELSEEVGNATTMERVAMALVANYEVDPIATWSLAIQETADNVRDETEVAVLVRLMSQLARDSVDAQDYSYLLPTIDSLVGPTQRPYGRTFQKGITEFRKEIQTIDERWNAYNEAYGAFLAGASDAAQRSVIGRWMCFSQQDWEAGLEHLSACDEPGLKAVADLELAHDGSPQKALALADRWWDLAQAGARDDRDMFIHRAGYWYFEALDPDLPAVDMDRIRDRLSEIIELDEYPTLDAPLAGFSSEFIREVRLEPVETIRFDSKQRTSIAFSPDGFRIAVANTDGKIEIYDITTGQLLRTLEEGRERWLSMSYTPDGSRFVAGSARGKIIMWDVDDGSVLGELTGLRTGISSIAVKPDNETVIASDISNQVAAWTRVGDPAVDPAEVHTSSINDMCLDPEGKLMATASDDKTVGVWTAAGRPRYLFDLHNERVVGVSFSSDGDLLASIDEGGRLIIWNARIGRMMSDFNAHVDDARSVEFLPFGDLVASVSRDGELGVWRASTGESLAVVPLSGIIADSVCVSPSGHLIAVQGINQEVLIYRIAID